MSMIEIEKPGEEPLGTWFETLRGWLDRNGCGGVAFARVGENGDRPVYRVAFADRALAEKFSRTFAVYPAGVPKAGSADGPGFILADAPA
ncbi:MAG TPA: hypothetical protein VGG57_20165 [Stellaceae bacterium]|jgi:hypothetical protein